MTRSRDTSGVACAVRTAAVPGCGTGPAGRAVFVARELADVWRELRSHAQPVPGQHIGDKD